MVDYAPVNKLSTPYGSQPVVKALQKSPRFYFLTYDSGAIEAFAWPNYLLNYVMQYGSVRNYVELKKCRTILGGTLNF